MKKLYLLKSILLLCALIVGSSAWAQSTVTFTPGTDTGSTSVTKNNVTVTMTTMNNSSYYQIYANQSGTFECSNGNITKIEFTCTASGTSKYGPGNASANVGSYSYSDNKGTWTGSAQSVTISSTAQVRMSSLSITYAPASTDPTITLGSSSLSGFTYVENNGPSTTKTVAVSGSNLTANINLSLGNNSDFEMCLTEDGTYTNSLALTPTTGTVAATNVYVRMKSGLAAGNKSGSITLTSTGATDATVSLSGSVTTLTVTYNANGADSGTAPTDATGYAHNGTVTVLGNTGNLVKEHYTFGGWNTKADGKGTTYTAGETFSITSNETLYAEWNLNTNTVTLPANDEYGEYSMNKTNPIAYSTEVTLTFTPASGYENYVATWSVNGTPISGNKFTMPDEAVTITVSLAEVFNMTLSNSDIVNAGIAAGGYDLKTITDSKNKTWNAYAIKNYHSNATSSNHFLQIKAYTSSTAYYIQVPEYGRKIAKLEMTVSSSQKAMDGGENTATLFFSASNSTSAKGTGVASGTGSSKVTIDCSSLNLNTGYITASGAVRIWDVKVTYDPIRLNGSGYATYATTTPIDYSDDSKFSAWAITSISGDAITFSQIKNVVPAGTGVLLMGTAGQAVEPVVPAANTQTTAPATNLLTGITTATPVTAGQYFGLSGATFLPVGEGTVPAGKALLPASLVSNARQLTFIFEDTQGIADVKHTALGTDDSIYTIGGQRVSTPKKGLYIMNGKKVLVK